MKSFLQVAATVLAIGLATCSLSPVPAMAASTLTDVLTVAEENGWDATTIDRHETPLLIDAILKYNPHAFPEDNRPVTILLVHTSDEEEDVLFFDGDHNLITYFEAVPTAQWDALVDRALGRRS